MALSLTTSKLSKRHFQKTVPAVNVSLAIQVDEQLSETVKKLCCFEARLRRRFLSRQLDAIFVALKVPLQDRTCKPGAIFSAICRGNITGVSNMFKT